MEKTKRENYIQMAKLTESVSSLKFSIGELEKERNELQNRLRFFESADNDIIILKSKIVNLTQELEHMKQSLNDVQQENFRLKQRPLPQDFSASRSNEPNLKSK